MQWIGLAGVLRHYRVFLRRSGRDQYRGLCPIHRGEGRDAFHANLSRNIFHCFSCGAGGTVLDFVAALEECSMREAARKLANGPSVSISEAPVPGPLDGTVTRKNISLSPLGFTLRGIDRAHPYLGWRGITMATAEEFGIGLYRRPGILSGRLVIPIHNAAGELVAYCGRSLNGSEPRYRFPSGFAKSAVLFNLHRAAAAGQDTVIIVEGFFDCFKLHKAGAAAVVAWMGAALYDAQQRSLLQCFRRVILMLDGDDAGRHTASIIAARLQRYAPVSLIRLADSVQPTSSRPLNQRDFANTHRNGHDPRPTLLTEVLTRSWQPTGLADLRVSACAVGAQRRRPDSPVRKRLQ
jgi:DNA primase